MAANGPSANGPLAHWSNRTTSKRALRKLSSMSSGLSSQQLPVQAEPVANVSSLPSPKCLTGCQACEAALPAGRQHKDASRAGRCARGCGRGHTWLAAGGSSCRSCRLLRWPIRTVPIVAVLRSRSGAARTYSRAHTLQAELKMNNGHLKSIHLVELQVCCVCAS
jgi:hypothetical protein